MYCTCLDRDKTRVQIQAWSVVTLSTVSKTKYAVGLMYQADTDGSLVSSLNCDRTGNSLSLSLSLSLFVLPAFFPGEPGLLLLLLLLPMY